MQPLSNPKALIYCRISDIKQAHEGDGLSSQEMRCRDHAKLKGYDVIMVFPDIISGGGDFVKRTGMVSLLAFMDAHPDEEFVVIFDDLKRFARDRDFHFKLREAFRDRKAKLECLNYRFDDTPEGGSLWRRSLRPKVSLSVNRMRAKPDRKPKRV